MVQFHLKCFNLLTSKVVICRTFKEFPYTHRYITLANSWGKSQRAREYGNKLKFLDWKKKAYNWDNEDIEESEGKVEPTSSTSVHPDLLAEIPGIKIASNLPDPQDPEPVEPTAQASDHGQTEIYVKFSRASFYCP